MGDIRASRIIYTCQHEITYRHMEIITAEPVQVQSLPTPSPAHPATAPLPDHEGEQSDRQQTAPSPYWDRYKEYLKDTGWPEASLANLDCTTSEILTLINNKAAECDSNGTDRQDCDIRGLVYGDIQAGKTSNYIGLICKAVDAGYRIVVVLTSNNNLLRQQTQLRLDEGFLGFDSRKSYIPLGVGYIAQVNPIPIRATMQESNDKENSPNNNGPDFQSLDYQILTSHNNGAPFLFVMKKNIFVLDRFIEWSKEALNYVPDFCNSPILIIDDEADNASPDTGVEKKSARKRKEEAETINEKLKAILKQYKRCAYVGYTATPFANLLIGLKEDEKLGFDLFPRDFIAFLPPPMGYFGPAQLFGGDSDNEKGLPIVHYIPQPEEKNDLEKGIKLGEKKRRQRQIQSVDKKSLEEAIISFLLACAVRSLRGQKSKISSMLVHTSQLIADQRNAHDKTSEILRDMERAYSDPVDADSLRSRFLQVWDGKEGFPATTDAIREIDDAYKNVFMPDFESVWKEMGDIFKRIENPLLINAAKGSDIVPQPEKQDPRAEPRPGKIYILVGGNILSRGLTIPGLVTSYFMRDSEVADSLLQMARWFGFRPRYLDVCRIFTTRELMDRYRRTYIISEDLREQAREAFRDGKRLTPLQFAYSMRVYPDLMPTSPGKMKNALFVNGSYDGSLVQTLNFVESCDARIKNYDDLTKLVKSLGEPASKEKGVTKWESKPAYDVIRFLESYESSRVARSVQASRLAEFIGNLNEKNELTTWRVCLVGPDPDRKGNLESERLAQGIDVVPTTRTASAAYDGSISVKVITSPHDESLSLDHGQDYDDALATAFCY